MPNLERIRRIKEFIKFFEVIPEDDWCVAHICWVKNGKETRCALGHLHLRHGGGKGLYTTIKELAELLRPELNCIMNRPADYISWLNDGIGFERYGDHPKIRILTVLKLCLEKESRSQSCDTAAV
jgi:hypothetical protein